MTGVENGLTLSPDGTLRLGGSLTGNTTIGINAKTQDFKIDIANNESTGTHGFFIKGLETQTSSNTVVVDVNTGKLGTAPIVPAKLAFFQSGTETNSIHTDLNTGNTVVVPWLLEDQVTNNLLTFLPTENAFQLTEDCTIEVSGMVNYRGGSGIDTAFIVINATLQIERLAGGGWTNYSSVRGIYVGTVSAYRNTLNIPPALILGKEGDKIRMVLQRPSGLGTNHDGSPDCGIVIPYGTSFSKSIKIIAQ
jgi:hypothetical protein